MGAVGDQPVPGDGQERSGRRPLRRRPEQRQERLGSPFHRPFGRGRRRPHVDPVRDHARQQRRPGRRAEFASPHRQGAVGDAGPFALEPPGEVGDLEAVPARAGVGLGHGAGHPRLRRPLVAAVHEQQPGHPAVPDLGFPAPDPLDESRPVGREGPPVGVGAVQIFGPHRRAVGGLPPEGGGGLGDGGRHPPPHDGVVDAGQPQELGDLGDMAEDVGPVADRRPGRTELSPAGHPRLEVPHDRLGRDDELVHLHRPGPDPEPPGGHRRPHPALRLGPHGQVVVDGGRLPVQPEMGQTPALQLVEEPVEQPDEPDPPRLERHVPLPVPVGVGHDPHADDL